MKTVPLGIAGLAVLASGLFGFSSLVRAQDGDGLEPEASRALAATVDYGNDAIFQPPKHNTAFERLGLQPQQVLTITVEFPVDLAGQVITAEPLDGGILTLPEEGLIVGSDGNVTFQFQASDSCGACRVAVHQADDLNFLQLWIVDPGHPENTPPGLPGVY